MVHTSKVKKRVFCITSSVRDILTVYPDTLIIASTHRYEKDSHKVQGIDNDGMVLLFYAILPSKAKKYEIDFDTDFHKKIRKVKASTIKLTANHEGSTGSYYSFGNKGPY